jgi:chitinase
MDNPTCPATVLDAPVHDMFDREKRSLGPISSGSHVLGKRAKDCYLYNWIRLAKWSTLLFDRRIGLMGDGFSSLWDQVFANFFGGGELTYVNLIGYIYDHAHLIVQGFIESILFNPRDAGAGLRRMRRLEDIICVYPEIDRRAVREVSGNDTKRHLATLRSRRIDVWGGFAQRLGPMPRFPEHAECLLIIPLSSGGSTRVPSWENILNGINAGNLTLHYARWVWATGDSGAWAGARHPPGPMLELVYWIGRTPGNLEDRETELWYDRQYRHFWHTRPDGDGDRWVVFHLHTEPGPGAFRSFGGRTYLGTPFIQMYHGHQVLTNHNPWRVDPRGAHTNRAGFNCPIDGNLRPAYYVGARLGTTELTEADQQFYAALQLWGESLFMAGYTGPHGQRLVYDQARRLPNGDIDPDHTGPPVENGSPSRTTGQNPYDRSFLIDNVNGQYQYNYNILGP